MIEFTDYEKKLALKKYKRKFIRNFRGFPLPKDMILDSLTLAWYIRAAYRLDDFFAVITEGVQRIGKTSLSSQASAEAFGEWEVYEVKKYGVNLPAVGCTKPNYDKVKEHMVFLPREFLNVVTRLETGKKQPVLIWDDAGFWLYALDWYEPFVKAVNKYIQLAGRQFSCIIFTTPSQHLISSKVLQAMPDFCLCRITKIGFDTPRRKLRQAKFYQRWDYPDGTKGGVYLYWVDRFDAMLPDEFYRWYKPISDGYLEQGKKLLKREVRRLDRRAARESKPDEVMEQAYKLAGDPDKLKEIDEILNQFL
ncbi:MAG: hypothetical protein DRN49_04330 [Thaumarchaeota archaeon]|nr:MAG: hypothetical protein DRN49_04330 [Nitrososphaerota archaeon]